MSASARRQERIKNPDDPIHGTLNGYNNGCRCRYCKASYHWYRTEKTHPERVSEAIDELALILHGE